MASNSGDESVLCISGVKVRFPPFRPFPGQIALMNKVLKAAQNRQNALLESPTGTGKTLALLCSTLSWQVHHFHNQQTLPPPKPELLQQTQPTPLTESTQPSRATRTQDEDDFVSPPPPPNPSSKDPEDSSARQHKVKRCAKIFFASRTQSQLLQVLKELKQCPGTLLSGVGVGSKKLKVTLLGARQHYCVNGTVLRKKKASVDEQCKKLLEDPERPKCAYYAHNHRLKNMVVKSEELFDVEDVKDMARAKRKGCPYFVARDLIKSAHIVLCPYNYLIDPWIRAAMNLEPFMEDAVVVIDEAHNLETAAREAVSFEITSRNMKEALAQLVGVCRNGLEKLHHVYQELHEFLQSFDQWCKRVISIMQEKLQEVWKGEEFLDLVSTQCGLNAEAIAVKRKSLAKALREEKNNVAENEDIEDSQVAYETELPLHARLALEKLLGCLHFLTVEEAKYSHLYRAVIIKQVDDESDGYRFCIWALNGQIAAQSLVQQTKLRSLVLSSGTLSPLGSFAAELCLPFAQALEAPHVTNIRTNLWAGVVGVGVQGCSLESTYRHVNSTAYQDDLGQTLVTYLLEVPHGALVFFPSYALLTKCLQRWQRNGIRRKLIDAKPHLFVEGKNKTDAKRLDKMIKDYQDKIDEGCTFLCVYRGKLSEGINLKDKFARAVFIIGIPYPPYQDLKISLKREFQDSCQGKGVQLSGNQWYAQQAWRALNQAVGRVIRHRLDYGAVVFLDHRFKQPSNLANLPKWMRSAVTTFASNAAALSDLRAFYQRHDKLLQTTSRNKTEVSTSDDEPRTLANSVCSQTQPSVAQTQPSATGPRRSMKRKPKVPPKNPRESTAKFGFIDKYFTKSSKKVKQDDEENNSALAQSVTDSVFDQSTQPASRNAAVDFLCTQNTSDDTKSAAKNVLDVAVKSLQELAEQSSDKDRALCDNLVDDIQALARQRGVS